MNREIKFRAKSLDGDLVYFELYEITNYFPADDVFYVGRIPCRVGSEQQYTGLKDKNGKEEYHFDITRNRYGQIRYIDEYCGAWWLMFPNDRNDKPLYGSAEAQEVIGTTFENPELLEVSDEARR